MLLERRDFAELLTIFSLSAVQLAGLVAAFEAVIRGD
ncbi:MAG: hypothetical protein ACI9HK_003343 [Pirellulaceae bacterium]|jgi:hypothetical protein